MTIEWQPIMSAPLDGTRVRVGHELDPNSMKVDSIFKTTGTFDEADQEWKCSSAFLCVDRYLRWQPTHWLPDADLSLATTPTDAPKEKEK